MNEARSRVIKIREQSKSLLDKIRDTTGFTVGKIFHEKSSRVGQIIFLVYN